MKEQPNITLSYSHNGWQTVSVLTFFLMHMNRRLSLYSLWSIILFSYTTPSLADQVKITGVSHISNIDYVSLEVIPPLYGIMPNEGRILASARADKDNYFEMSFELDSLSVVDFKISGLTLTVFPSPGDVVEFVIQPGPGNKPSVFFKGHNAAHYNYETLVSKKFGGRTHLPLYSRANSLLEHKDNVSQWYLKRNAFLTDYLSDQSPHTKVGEYLKNELAYHKEMLLIYPIRTMERDSIPMYYREALDKPARLSDVKPHYSANSAYVNTYIFAHNYPDVSQAIQTLDSEPDDEFKTYMLLNMVGYYSKTAQKSSISEADSTLIMKTIRFVESKTKDSLWLAYLENCEVDFSILGNPIPLQIQQETLLIDFNGTSQITLGQVLSQHKKQAIYIDFWASWCGACIENSRHSTNAKEFIQGQNIAYLYFSIDRDPSQWERAATIEQITNKQYLIVENTQSALVEFLKINVIPRYILLDENHQLVSIYTASPHETDFNNLKSTIANMYNKSIEY